MANVVAAKQCHLDDFDEYKNRLLNNVHNDTCIYVLCTLNSSSRELLFKHFQDPDSLILVFPEVTFEKQNMFSQWCVVINLGNGNLQQRLFTEV